MTYRSRLTLISCLAILLFIGFPKLFSINPVSERAEIASILKKQPLLKAKSPFKIKSPSVDNLDNKNKEKYLESEFAKSILRDNALFSLSIQNEARIKQVAKSVIKEINNLILNDSAKKESSFIPIPNFMTASHGGHKKSSESSVAPWEDFQKIAWDNLSNIEARLIPRAVRISENLALPESTLKIDFKNENDINNIKVFIDKYVIDSEDYILNDGFVFEENLDSPGSYAVKQGTNEEIVFGYLNLRGKSLSLEIKGKNLENESIFNAAPLNFERRNSVLSQTLPFGEDGVFVDFKMLELFRPEVMEYLERRREADPESTFFETVSNAILSINKGNLSQLSTTFQGGNIEQGRACLSLEEKDEKRLPHWENLLNKENSEKNTLSFPSPNSLLGFYSKSNQLETLLQTFPNSSDSFSYQLAQVKNKTEALIDASATNELSLSVTPASKGLLPEVALDISSNTLNSSSLKESTPQMIKSFIPGKAASFITVNNERSNINQESSGAKNLFKQLFGIKLQALELNKKAIRIQTSGNDNILNTSRSEDNNADFSIIANTNFIASALNPLNSDSTKSKNSKINSLSGFMSKKFTEKTGNTYSYSHKAEKLEEDLVCLDIVTQKLE